MRRHWHRSAAAVPLGMNALLCLYLTVWMMVRTQSIASLAYILVGAWLACGLVSLAAFGLFRWLSRERRPVLALVPPILAFLLFGSLAVGALTAMAQP